MKKLGVWVLASATAWPSAALARDLLLEEVVVTAQKREQNAMDVPVTIDTFSNKDLENTGALVIEDIAAFIPGFDTGDGVTQNTIKIRGVENSNISSGQDPSVASFFDEVYLPAAAVTVSFSDIAQIEVLKGPQGTLFGRNAALGVVNMIPNQPNMEELEAFIMAKVGSSDIRRFEGMVNVPLRDDMALRFNVLTNQRAASAANRSGPKSAGSPLNSPDPREADNIAARLAFKWDVTDKLAMQLAYDYDKVDNGAKAAYGLGPNSDFPDVKGRRLGQDTIGTPGERRDMYSVIGKLWYDINDSLTMKFITSYRPYETYNLQDEDGTSSDIYLDTNNIYDSDIFYNELQFNWSASFAEFVFGLNYSEEDVYQRTDATGSKELVVAAVGSDFGPGAVILADFSGVVLNDYTTERLTNTGDFQNYGVYFDAEVTVFDWLSVLGGLRYSVDKKTFTWFTPDYTGTDPAAGANGANLIFPATNGVEEGSKSWSDITGRFVVNAQISEGAMAFFTYSTGYKSGGFDSLAIATKDEPLDPEIVENIELGVKGDFLGARLRTQLSAFYTTIDGRQEVIESRDPGATAARPVIVNADEEITGFEWTLDYLPIEELRFGLVFTLRENDRVREPYYDSAAIYISNDQSTASAPKDYTITVDWQVPFSIGSLFLHADYIFKDNISRDSEDHREVFNTFPGYAEDTKIINLRLTWVSDDGYEFSLWGQNLDHDDSFGTPGGLIAGITGDYVVEIQKEASWGVDAKWTF